MGDHEGLRAAAVFDRQGWPWGMKDFDASAVKVQRKSHMVRIALINK
jgi:hypothetical protein